MCCVFHCPLRPSELIPQTQGELTGYPVGSSSICWMDGTRIQDRRSSRQRSRSWRSVVHDPSQFAIVPSHFSTFNAQLLCRFAPHLDCTDTKMSPASISNGFRCPLRLGPTFAFYLPFHSPPALRCPNASPHPNAPSAGEMQNLRSPNPEPDKGRSRPSEKGAL